MRPRHQDAADVLDRDDAFDERGLLKDGKAVRVSLTMMDADSLSPLQRAVALSALSSSSALRATVTDGAGSQEGLHRPGFRLAADAAALDARREAHRLYEEALTSAWRGTASTAAADESTPTTLDEAYRDYEEALTSAWRSREQPAPPAARTAQLMDEVYADYDRQLQEAWRA